MNKHQILILILINVIIFSFYLARPDIYGYDSYAHYNYVCNKSVTEWYQSPLAKTIFDLTSLLPCNFLIPKIQMFILMLATTFIIAGIGKEFKRNSFHIAIWATCLTPLLALTIYKYENDAFSIPLMFISLYFLQKFLNTKQKKLLH